jgi:hypothetical protein
MRAEAEDIYGARLGDIEAATNRVDGGFSKDDGASVKKVSSKYASLKDVPDISRHSKAFAPR